MCRGVFKVGLGKLILQSKIPLGKKKASKKADLVFAFSLGDRFYTVKSTKHTEKTKCFSYLLG